MSDIERMLPLYEGKMIHHFDHRWATFENDGSTRDVTLEKKQDPHFSPLPRYWVRESVVEDKLAGVQRSEELLGFRDITNTTNERTVIASHLPVSAVGHTSPLIFDGAPPKLTACFSAMLSSFALDFVARQKMGGTHLTYSYFQQLALLLPTEFLDTSPWNPSLSLKDWLCARIGTLVYTKDLERFVRSLGVTPSKNGWDRSRRPILRAELDAAFFHLYGLEREDVDYIMDTFPIVQRNDEAAHGEFRTKRLILEAYDAMAEAMRTQTPFVSTLDPPPESFLDEPVE